MPRAEKRAAAMPLIEHLRELRKRLVVSAAALTVAMVPGWIWFDEVFAWLRAPFDQTIKGLGPGIGMVLPGVMDPFSLQLQISAYTAVILSSPVWLSQLWGFITPGLKRREKMWTYLFVLFAVPLGLSGIALAYYSMPVGLQLLLGFTPENVQNLISVDKYIEFVVKMSLAFAVGFLSPLVMVMANLAGVLSAAKIRSWWRGIVILVMIFAAVATPTGDPFNMLLLGLPILALVFLAWAASAVNDWRRKKKQGPEVEWDDDEASPLDVDWS